MDRQHKYEAYRKAINEDNILIKYSTLFGFKMLERTDGYPKTVERLRFNPEHLAINKDGKEIKYKSAKASKRHPFLNGLYTYYVKPLQEQGLTEQQIIKKLKPTFQKITITEGEFKAFTGCKHGLPVIAISGIHNGVKTIKTGEYERTTGATFLIEILDFLKTFNVKEINFLLDADCFDNLDKSDRASSFFGAVRNFWFACQSAKVKMNFNYIKSDAVGKGLDDLIINNGCLKDSLVSVPVCDESDLEKIKYSFWDSVVEKEKNRLTVYEGKEGQRASVILKGVDISNKWLIVPTGAGKTYLAANSEGVKIVLCPTTALVKNIVSGYGGFECRGRGNKWRQKIEDAKNINDLPNLLVTTYKGFENLYNLLGRFKNDIHLFVDEAHNFSAATSAGFMLKECRFILDGMADFKAVTLLTGTYIFNAVPYLNSLGIIKVNIPRPTKEAQIIFAANTLKACAMIVQESVYNKRFPIVLYDNKSTDGRLGTLQKLIQTENISYFNADNKQDVFFAELNEHSNINSIVKGIVTTSVLKEGNNINNPYHFDIIILGNFHSAAIEQILNRPRKAKSINLHIIKKLKENEEIKSSSFKAAFYSKDIEQKTINVCDELNTNDGLEFELYKRELRIIKAIQYNPIYIVNSICKVDYLALSNYVYEKQKNEESADIDLLKKNLEAYGIEFKDDNKNTEPISKAEQATASAARGQSTADKDKKYKDEVSILENIHPIEIVRHCKDYRGRNASTSIRKSACNRYLSLSEYLPHDEIIKHLYRIGRSKNRFAQLMQQLNIIRLESNDDYMDSNRKVTIILKKIRTTFDKLIGETLTGDQVKDLLIGSIEAAESKKESKKMFRTIEMRAGKRNTPALKKARLFYDIKRTVVREIVENESKTVTKYKICCLSLSNSLIEQYPKLRQQNEITSIEKDLITSLNSIK